MAHSYTYKQIRSAISACEHKIKVEPSRLMQSLYRDRLEMWQQRLKDLQEKTK